MKITNNKSYKQNNMEKFKKVMSITLFVLSVAISFVLGYFTNDVNEKMVGKPNPFTDIHTYNQTSVSVTERGELLVIQRDNGETIVLDNTVGMSIFKAYANTIYKENTK